MEVHAQKKGHVRTQHEGSHQQTKEKSSPETNPAITSLELPASTTVRKKTSNV